KRRPRDEWLLALEQAGVPAGPINTLEQVYQNPQVKARGLLQMVPHPVAGHVPTVASPMRLSASPNPTHRGPPLLGEHTALILRERLGMSEDEIARFMAADT